MPREDIVEAFLMLLCWTPMSLTCIIVMILGTLWMLFFFLDTQRSFFPINLGTFEIYAQVAREQR